MAEAFPRCESDDFPLVTGDYELIEVTEQSSEEYLRFCFALYGGGAANEYKYKMYANADGKLMLFPKMHEGTEMWDYRYSSVLRKIRNTFRTGVPFKEMQDDCLTTDTTATLVEPNTLLLTHHHQSGQVYTTKMEFNSTRMIATHEYNGVTASRIWRRVIGGVVVEDLMRLGEQAMRNAQRRAEGELSPHDSSGDSGTDQSVGSNSQSPNEDSEILHRPNCKTPTGDSSNNDDDDDDDDSSGDSSNPPISFLKLTQPPPPPPPSSPTIQ